ncbi:MAG: hypothetical protein WC489_05025 [Patescibacteria group bacterium]
MRKLFLILITFLILNNSSFVFADEFTITKIGSLNVNGKYFTHWWYEPTKLTLQGTGSKGANIDITIDENTNTIKVPVDSGTWLYTHDKELEKKDHTVSVASGGQEIKFILTIGAGSVPPGEATKGGLLDAGVMVPLIFISAFSALFIFLAFKKDLLLKKQEN